MQDGKVTSVSATDAAAAIAAAEPLIKHALSMFNTLRWKPLAKEELAASYVTGYGKVDPWGDGCVCIIDPVARLLQVKLVQKSSREKIVSNCMVNWEDTRVAIDRFDHYMDVTGNFYKEAWLGGKRV